MADVKVKYIGDTSSLDRATAKTTQSLDKLGRQTQQAQGKLTNAQKATQGAAKSFTGLNVGAGVAAAGIGFLAAGFTTMISEAVESEKVTNQTMAALRSTGGAAQVSAQQISKLADSISKKTGIDDEQIQSGENLLLTFTNIRNEVGKGNDIFNQATKAAVDVSAAMGQDLKTSVVQLGKALNDPIKGIGKLTKIGVTFTDQQKAQIKVLTESGNRLGAQKIILAELNKEFGGSAEAQANAIDKMKVSVKNLAESLGRIALPRVEQTATALGLLADTLSTSSGKTTKFGSVINTVFPTLGGLFEAGLSPAQKNVKELDSAIKKLADDVAKGASKNQIAEDQKAVTKAQSDQLPVQQALTSAIGAATKTQDAKAKSDKLAAQNAKDMTKALKELGDEAGPAAVALAKALKLPLADIKAETDAVKDLKSGFESSFDSAADALDKFKDKTKVSFDEFAKQQLKSIAAAANWADNIARLSRLGIDQGFLKTLADAGPTQAGLVQSILDNVKKGSVQTINSLSAQTEAKTKTDRALADARTGVYQFGRFIDAQHPNIDVSVRLPNVKLDWAKILSSGPGDTGNILKVSGSTTFIPVGGPPKPKALGGPVMANMPYLVGERGPETFVPRQSGEIVPNGRSGKTELNATVVVSEIDSGDRLIRKIVSAVNSGRGKADLQRALGIG